MLSHTQLSTHEYPVELAGSRSYDIVLLHGLFGSLSNWSSVSAEFSVRHSVHIPRLPLLDTPVNKPPLDALVSFLKDYIDRRRLNKVVLVGNSLGGHVALLFTLNYPDLVEKLILTGSSGLYENAFNRTFPRVKDHGYITEKIKYTFHKTEVVTDDLVSEVFTTIQSPRKTIAIICLARSAQKNNLEKQLANVHVPVLLIWGLQDKITPPEVAYRFLEGLPNATLKLIDECGHVPMMEQPLLFNQYLNEFLES